MGRQPEYNGGVISENISGIYLVGGFNHEKNSQLGRIIPYIMEKNVPNHQSYVFICIYIYILGGFIDGKWSIYRWFTC